MDDRDTELLKRLVVGHKRDGRCLYDPEAKRALVALAIRPGVSVARLALEHGINANLLRTWIWQSRRRQAAEAVTPAAAGGAFIPVVTPRRPASTGSMRLTVTLGNGVRLELAEWVVESLPVLLGQLNALPCSGSIPS